MGMGALAVGCVVVIAAVFCLVILGDREPLYSAAIDSASGLGDPAHLKPVFNLTLRIRTRSIFSRGCAAPGSALEAGAVLARGPGAASGSGASSRGVARGGSVASIPGFAMDALAADVRNGVRPAFDVAVWMPTEPLHPGTLVTCGGAQISDSAVVMTLSGDN